MRARSSCPSAPSTRRASWRYADLVISAGGTMNREAVALGTPVYTTFEGGSAQWTSALLARGPPARLTNADDVARGAADGSTAACASGATRANSSHSCSPPQTR